MPDETAYATAPTPLVTSDWLAANLDRAEIKLLDATWHMPDSGRNARAEFEEFHIPCARFFDLEAVSEPGSALPHMLPAAAHFSASMQALGLENDDTIVVYDSGGVSAAARAWWMFRVFGHRQVAVLDGGLQKWRAEGGAVEAGAADRSLGGFTATIEKADIVADVKDIKEALDNGSAAVLDARGPGRFSGVEKEPRAGLRSGHMPGARNLFYAGLYDDNGCMKDVGDLERLFEKAGIDTAGPVITTCGSGVTACILSLALLRVGNRDNRVYDGSWVEWGGRSDTDVATGPA